MQQQSDTPNLLTPTVLRRLSHRSQMQVAVAAGVGVALVRVFELDPRSVRDPEKRVALARVYATLRDELLTTPR